MELKTVYFEHAGKENTDETLRIAKQRAEELGIKIILVASTFGDTGVRAVEVLKAMRVIVVTHPTGSRENNDQELTEENRKIIEGKGGIILTGITTFGGLGWALRQQKPIPQAPQHYVIGDIVCNTLRIVSQGTKVACEIASMAADAGLVRTDEDVISIGGTGRGADTALVLRPANTFRFFELRIREILCKPHF